MAHNYIIVVNILSTCNMQLSDKTLFRNASTLWWQVQASWNKAITEVLWPISHTKSPLGNCTAPSSLPLWACLYSCLHLSHIHRHLCVCFITGYFLLSGSKTPEICWHFWCCLTMHHLYNDAQQAFNFPRISISFLGDHPARDERPKPALTSSLCLSSAKHERCPFTAETLHWL